MDRSETPNAVVADPLATVVRAVAWISIAIVLAGRVPDGIGQVLLLAMVATIAVGPYLIPTDRRHHPGFHWGIDLVDGGIIGLCLLIASPGDSTAIGLYLLAFLVALLASGIAGWPLAGLAAPGLYLVLAMSTGGLQRGDIAMTVCLASSSYHLLLAVRRVNVAAFVFRRARRESQELWALLEITDTVTGTLDLPKVMGLIVQRVSELVDAESCSILVADDRLANCFVVASNERPELDMLEIDLANYPELRQALETREPVVVDDIERDPLLQPVRELLLEKGYRSMMVLPLLFGREVLGTLFLRASRDRPFTPEEIRFCKVAAGASANALKNAMLYQDVSREADLHRATGEKLRRVLDCTPDLIVATDADGRVTEFNGGAERIVGVAPAEAHGQPLARVLGAPDLDLRDTDEPSDGVHRKDITLERDGIDREISMASAPLVGDDDGNDGRVWVGRDVTHMRRVERTLAQAERLTTLGEIVAGVAHELNNPLSAVLGYSELMRNDTADAAHARDLDRVVESARRCKRIVENLLGFARKHQPEKRHADLNRTVRKVLDLKSYHLKNSEIRVSLELDPDLPTTSFDRYQLEQVLMNLMTNAQHAVATTGRPGTITVRTYAAGDSVHLEVEDDGPGVPEDIRARVFDPFFTTKEIGHGTGLGLSVSFGILQEHGGGLELRTPLAGDGARFHLRLPRVDEPAVAAPVAVPLAEPDQRRPLVGSRILVAEDEPLVLEFFSRVLEQEGVAVTRARDGQEAWEKLADAEFDLIVADLRMPRLDGEELYRRVAEERPDMLRRFVFASGDLCSPETLAFLRDLPNRMLSKPLQIETVRHVLSQALDQLPSRR